ncbi:MAG: wax ester/triacylglycerol synthase domain-containing protein [Actinomycetota bacterium]
MSSRSRELRFENKMTDAEALMWNIEKDPWLSPNGAMVTILDQPVDVERFRRHIRNAVAEVPRLRERVVPGFGRLAPPTWAADPEFDLDYHIRHVALPGEGSIRQLLDLCTQWYEDPYDRTRPLWQFVLIDGLEGGRGAMFSKMHHSITDGIGAMRLSEKYLTLERDADAPAPVDLEAIVAEAIAGSETAEANADGVSPGNSLRRSLGHVARRQAGLARRALGEVATWTGDPLLARDFAEDVSGQVKAVLDQLDGDEESRPGSPLFTDRSRGRRLEVVTLEVDDLKAAGKALGASINDLFVAGVALGAVAYHEARDVELEGLNTSFVVSTRSDDAIGGNSFTPTMLHLPGSAESPEAYVAEARDRMTARREAVAGDGALSGLAGVANLLPTSVVTQVARAQAGKLDIATSNLRGAWFPTFVGGALVERNIVLGPVSGTAMNVTAMSSNGRFEIGMVIDPAAVEDPAEFRDHVATAFAGLLAHAED